MDFWKDAEKDGWSAGRWGAGDPSGTIPFLARQAGWEPVGTRAGEGPVSTLRPVTQTEARSESMSAIHGLKAQPLHIDGSHMLRPPDIVLLFSAAPNATPTRLWKPGRQDFRKDAARNGLFMVGHGRSAFLAPALDSDGWRYDPVIMRPADERARSIATELDEGSERHATEVSWDHENAILVVANRKVLHGRAAVPEGDKDRKLIRMAFYTRRGSN